MISRNEQSNYVKEKVFRKTNTVIKKWVFMSKSSKHYERINNCKNFNILTQAQTNHSKIFEKIYYFHYFQKKSYVSIQFASFDSRTNDDKNCIILEVLKY